MSTPPKLLRPEPGQLVKIFNGRILRGNTLQEGGTLWFKDGRIVDPIEEFWQEKASAECVLDAQGMIISPGYLDIQINGAFGVDFTSDPLERMMDKGGLERARQGLVRHGCTAICPTIVSSHAEVYADRRKALTPSPGSLEQGAAILGLHLEGPFISDDRSGAHETSTLQKQINGIEGLEKIYGPLRRSDTSKRNPVSIMTIASELPGALETIPQLVQEGIVVSQGHSMANISQAEEAVEKGATLITHLFNAMHPFHHRDPGIIGLLGATELEEGMEAKNDQHHVVHRPFYGVIADGVHSHPNSIRMAYSTHPDGLVLVTDALAPMGLPSGQYRLGEMDITKSDHDARVTGTDILAGSVITLAQCVRNFRHFTGSTQAQALLGATLHPARALGIEHERGSLTSGAVADLLFLDDDLHVKRVFIHGQEIEAEDVA